MSNCTRVRSAGRENARPRFPGALGSSTATSPLDTSLTGPGIPVKASLGRCGGGDRTRIHRLRGEGFTFKLPRRSSPVYDRPPQKVPVPFHHYWKGRHLPGYWNGAGIFGLGLALLFSAASAWSAPNLLTYQGRLQESGALVTGNRSVEIVLCDLVTGGSDGINCHLSGAQGVAVSNGVFRTTFTLPSPVNLDVGNWFLEVRVGGTALSPRERLTSSPYALHSTTATGVAAAGVRPGVLGTGIHFADNMGVGTTSPGSRLHIDDSQGAASTTPMVILNNSAASGQNILDFRDQGTTLGRIRAAGGGSFFVESQGAADLRMMTGGSVRMTLKSGGSLGIGDGFISPSSRLHIQDGDIRISTTSGSRGIIFQDGTTQNTAAAGPSGWAKSGAVVSLVNGADNVVVQSTLTVQGNAFSVGGSTLVVTAGRMGIGTTSPAARLSLSGGRLQITGADSVPTSGTNALELGGDVGGATSLLLSYNRDLSAYGNLRYDANTHLFQLNSGDFMRMTTGPRSILVGDTPGMSVGNAVLHVHWDGTGGDPARLLKLSTGPASAAVAQLVVSTSGRVGIGVFSPTHRLQVRGDGTTSQSYFRIEDSNASPRWLVGSDVSGNAFTQMMTGGALSNVVIHTGGDSYLNGGNVGIGTVSPGTKLDVAGDAQFGSGAAKSTFTATGALNLVGGSNALVVGLSTFVVTSGRVGIGLTNPGNGLSGAFTGGLHIRDSGDNPGIVIEHTGSAFSRWYLHAHGPIGGNSFAIRDDDLDQEPFYIDDQGRIGIQTTSPAATLTVAGGVRVTTLNVTGAGLTGGATAFWVVGGTFVVRNDGRIGIGTTFPQARLEIKGAPGGADTDNGILLEGGGAINWMTNSGPSIKADGVGIFLSASDPIEMLIRPNGDVGIGRNDTDPFPGARLHVSSANATATQNVLIVSSGTGAGDALLIVKGGGEVSVNGGLAVKSTAVLDGGNLVSAVSNANVNVLRVLRNGHIETGNGSTTLPTLGPGCGSIASVNGNDSVGTINIAGGGTLTNCPVVFNSPWPAGKLPTCVVVKAAAPNGPLTADVTTSSVTFRQTGAFLAGEKLHYICLGHGL